MAHTNLQIAVVDDDASVLKALTRLLRACGYEVTAFASGTDFLQASKAQLPDCVVMDIHMPEMTGLDVYAVLLERKVCVPVIFITAYNDNSLRLQAQEMGAVAFLSKPLTEDTLVTAIEKSAMLKHTG
jgi:FixJ family two-component response regulator